MFRWISVAVLVSAMGISIHFRRKARREGATIPRTRERPTLITLRVLVALPLFGGILAYLLDPALMHWASFPASGWLRWLGAVMAACTVPGVYWVFRSLGRNVSETVLTKADHELVVHGPYRWVRHPLYSMGVALVVGIGLMAASWFILLFGAVAWLGIRLVVIPEEERTLVETFGDAYHEYRRRTGRLLPALLGRGGPDGGEAPM